MEAYTEDITSILRFEEDLVLILVAFKFVILEDQIFLTFPNHFLYRIARMCCIINFVAWFFGGYSLED